MLGNDKVDIDPAVTLRTHYADNRASGRRIARGELYDAHLDDVPIVYLRRIGTKREDIAGNARILGDDNAERLGHFVSSDKGFPRAHDNPQHTSGGLMVSGRHPIVMGRA